MKARIKWIEGASFAAESGSGHAMVLDGAPEQGGRNIGMRPMEMLLIGMGGCTAFDVVSMLKKGRQAVSDCVVEVDAERAADPPKVFTRIHVKYTVSGRALRRAAVERAIDLSTSKYCSATIMLQKSATVTHEFEIVDTGIVETEG